MRPPHVSRFTFALSLLLLLPTVAWIPAPQMDGVAVVGQVTNGTPGGAVVADLSVALDVFSGMEETEVYTTTLAADGSFRFDGLILEDDDILMARVVYQDVTYVSDLVPAVSPVFDQQQIALPVTVYETTDESSAIQIGQVHIFVSVVEGNLQIGEYYLVGNTGNRTYVGEVDPDADRRVTLSLTLPEGAEGLRFDGPGLGERYLRRGGAGGFADTEPVVPGSATVETLFSYELAYREGMQVERTFEAPVASVALVLSGEGVALEGDGISLGETMDTQMGPAVSYTAGPLAAGETIAFTLVTRPEVTQPTAPPGASLARNTARETSVGLVALAAAVVAAYLIWRPPAPGTLPAQARPLVETIAVLDADFEAGQMREEAYRQKRQSLKRQLRALLGGGQETIGGGTER
ncbi:MAG: hypothetical protein SXV54_12425 [Chloroflexota bacterium]|nr:hypothetical protein [Chloroflexota bacterium]